MHRLFLLAGCLLAGFCLFATSAFAATTTRFASPTGTVSMTATCTEASLPCSIGTALGAARTGDNLSLANGVYDLAGKTLPAIPLHWMPTDPTTRPILTSAATPPTLTLTSAQSGTTFDHLEIDNTGNRMMVESAVPLAIEGGDVTVRSTVLTGLNCIQAFGLGKVEIDDSTLNATRATTCAMLGTNTILRRSTIQPPEAVISTATPPPVAATSGLIEDSTVTGGLELVGNAVARRVRAIGTTGILGEGLVVDSFAEGFGDKGAAIEAGPFGGTLRVVGSTAIGKRAPALLATSVVSADPIDPNKLVVTDSIASSDIADLQAIPSLQCQTDFFCADGMIQIDHSLFNTRSPAVGAPGAALITAGAGNRTGDARFTDPIRNNYHLLPGSPAIDAGVVNPDAAPSDLDGKGRVQGKAPDLGAFETTAPAGAGGAGSGAGNGTPGGGGPNTRAAIVVSRLAIKPSHLHVDGRAKIQFNLDKAASVKLTFARQVVSGHHKRFRTVGHLTVRKAKAGKNTVLFLGRVGGKPLRRGRYRLTVTPSGGKARTVLLTVLP